MCFGRLVKEDDITSALSCYLISVNYREVVGVMGCDATFSHIPDVFIQIQICWCRVEGQHINCNSTLCSSIHSVTFLTLWHGTLVCCKMAIDIRKHDHHQGMYVVCNQCTILLGCHGVLHESHWPHRCPHKCIPEHNWTTNSLSPSCSTGIHELFPWNTMDSHLPVSMMKESRFITPSTLCRCTKVQWQSHAHLSHSCHCHDVNTSSRMGRQLCRPFVMNVWCTVHS